MSYCTPMQYMTEYGRLNVNTCPKCNAYKWEQHFVDGSRPALRCRQCDYVSVVPSAREMREYGQYSADKVFHQEMAKQKAKVDFLKYYDYMNNFNMYLGVPEVKDAHSRIYGSPAFMVPKGTKIEMI